MTIRNPIEWSADSVMSLSHVLGAAISGDKAIDRREPVVRRITFDDLGTALAQGWADFKAYRTDVLFLCLIYPLAGLVAINLAMSRNMIPLLFPIISGFALVGPFLAAGLYEMSRRQEQGKDVSWLDAFGGFRSPSIGNIVKLALVMTGLFVLWLLAAMGVHRLVFATAMPESITAFATEVLTTSRGLALILVGGSVGFLFALSALALSVVSFPLLIDRRVTVTTAVRTSFRVMAANPIVILGWGFIVASLLVLGALPALLGMIVVMPVLGHATWHLYRRVVT